MKFWVSFFWLSIEEVGLYSHGFNAYFPKPLNYLFICLLIILYPYLWNAVQLSSAYFYWVAFLFLSYLKELLIYCGCNLCQLCKLQIYSFSKYLLVFWINVVSSAASACLKKKPLPHCCFKIPLCPNSKQGLGPTQT